MFNYDAIDKTPTVNQIKAIINYMENSPKNFDFSLMMGMKRESPNVIYLDLNDAHSGMTYKITFKKDRIVGFKYTGQWMS